jgi:hypothetical protein
MEKNEESTFNCLICEEKFLKNSKFDLNLNGCQHLFCVDCMKIFLENEIKESKLPMKCPGDKNKCNNILQSQFILSIVDEDFKNKYLNFSLNKYFEEFKEDLSWCPTPGCPFGFELDKICNKFSCPNCLKVYCLECKSAYHEKKTCEENINDNKLNSDKKFYEFANTLRIKECPKCKRWIERASGCNHMTCVCKYEFCYICGKESTESHSNCTYNFNLENLRNRTNTINNDTNVRREENLIRDTQINSNSNRINYFHNIFNDMYSRIGNNHITILANKNDLENKYNRINEKSEIKLPTKKDGTFDMRYSINKQIVSNYDNLQKDGIHINSIKKSITLDLRHNLNKNQISLGNEYIDSPKIKKSYITHSNLNIGPTKQDGTLDMRYSVNKEYLKSSMKSNIYNYSTGYDYSSQYMKSGPCKKDGTLDMRYSVNRDHVKSYNSNHSNYSSYSRTGASTYSSYSSYGMGPTKKDGTLDMRYAVNKRK